ncbi:MAG TPA: endonuclease/exonuclease/phosphatase family protein [Thioploca sp.]|nr:endonuclease/exonuclease/phosphatase family protein [Thioploca sp.]
MKLPSREKIRRLFFQITGLLLATATLFLIVFAIFGHTVRDRTIALAFMMYIPLLPLGIGAIMLDLLLRGRSLSNFRFGLSIIGILLIVWGYFSMTGAEEFQANTAIAGDSMAPNTTSLLHWNVNWGGVGYDDTLKNQSEGKEWASIREDIYPRHPDIIVLNEPPQLDAWLEQLTQQMGEKWSILKHYRTKRNGIAIASAWPLKLERLVKIRNGAAISVVVTVRKQPLRLLLVDGERSVRKLRTPLLTDIIQAAIDSDKQGQPVDMIVGDFNAVSRSVGFDTYATAAGGYQLAGKATHGWRGTWPSISPMFDFDSMFDIDHVWIHKRFQILHVEMFSHPNTDHRGQQLYFNLPKPPTKS